jgi:hypothetical protein
MVRSLIERPLQIAFLPTADTATILLFFQDKKGPLHKNILVVPHQFKRAPKFTFSWLSNAGEDL